MIPMESTYGKASDAQLDALEHRLTVKLPHPYREFLKEQNGGRPLGGDFDVPGWGETLLCDFYAVEAPNKSYDLERAIERLSDVIESQFVIPIASDPAGNHICLGVGGKYFGKVYFWDHENWDEERGAMEALIELNSSLDEFLMTVKFEGDDA